MPIIKNKYGENVLTQLPEQSKVGSLYIFIVELFKREAKAGTEMCKTEAFTILRNLTISIRVLPGDRRERGNFGWLGRLTIHAASKMEKQVRKQISCSYLKD